MLMFVIATHKTYPFTLGQWLSKQVIVNMAIVNLAIVNLLIVKLLPINLHF